VELITFAAGSRAFSVSSSMRSTLSESSFFSESYLDNGRALKAAITDAGIRATVMYLGPSPIGNRMISARLGIEMIERSSLRVLVMRQMRPLSAISA
jgi:hypothetical protein